MQKPESPSAHRAARHTEYFVAEKFAIGFVDSGADKTLVGHIDQRKLEIAKKHRPITSYGRGHIVTGHDIIRKPRFHKESGGSTYSHLKTIKFDSTKLPDAQPICWSVVFLSRLFSYCQFYTCQPVNGTTAMTNRCFLKTGRKARRCSFQMK